MRIPIPEEKTFVHESIIPIRWGDMDAFGHVNNAVYFRYIEQARINWLDSLGLNFAQDEQGVVVVNAFCNFMKPVEYPADLIIKTYIANPTRVGLDTFNVMSLVSDPDTIRGTSEVTHVSVDFKTEKAASWPPELKAKLAI